MRLVDLVSIHRESSSGIPVLLLREHDAPVEEELDLEGEVEKFRDLLVSLEPSDFLPDAPETVQHADPGVGGDDDDG